MERTNRKIVENKRKGQIINCKNTGCMVVSKKTLKCELCIGDMKKNPNLHWNIKKCFLESEPRIKGSKKFST